MRRHPTLPHAFSDMPDTMSDPVKPAVRYVTKGERRRQANTARAESDNAPEDSSAAAVADSPWKRSKRQGLEKAIAALGEEELQDMVSQFKQATSKEVGD